MRRFAYHRPRTIEEAFRLKQAEPGARWIAGGTDVMVQARGGHAPPALISLTAIRELRGITVGEGARIGALTPFADVAAHAGLRERYPVLVEAASAVGSVQIRNLATIGGNLANASPCADSAPALLVLDARLRIAGPGGAREVPVEQFFRGPGRTCLAPDELLTDVLLDPPGAGRACFRKKGRVRMDLALASVAVLLELEGGGCRRARVAAGSVAPVPLRLHEVEDLLTSGPLGDGLVARAEEAARRGVAPITDVRGTAEYRRAIVGVFVRRAIQELSTC